jgi:hypothetical protein
MILTNKIIRKNLIESLLEGLNKTQINPDFDIVYRGDNILVVVPKTKSAACKYGSGTKWCSANPDYGSNNWGGFEKIRKDNILYYIILYKDTPEGKIEDYKIAVQKKVATGSESWTDMGGKRIYNMEMVKKFILTDPIISQKINEYWKLNRDQWRPKFNIGDYVKPKSGYWTKFTDKYNRGIVEVNWSNIRCVVVGESKSRLLIQIVRMSPELANITAGWQLKSKEQLETAFANHWLLQKWVNPYNFIKLE